MAKILFENKEDVYVDSSIPDINKVKADDMNNIKEAVNTNENKILLAISDTAPSTCATGDLYYNTTSKKIFEATGTNTWGTTGTNPTSNTIYILFDTKTTYSYDGTDLVSVGGGGAEISVSTTEPTGDEDDSVKIWINPNEAPSGSLNPISNTYGVAQDKGYSQEYLNPHTQVEITPSNCNNYSNYGNSFYYVVGNRVHIHLGLKDLTANTPTNVFTMPSGLRPSYTTTSIGISGDTKHFSIAQVNSSGQISITAVDYGFSMVEIEYDYV